MTLVGIKKINMKYFLVIFFLGVSLFGFSQKSEIIIATLNDSIKSWDLLVNAQPYHTIKKGELFYYYPKIETACSVNGKSGRIPLKNIKKIDSLNYLRFEYTPIDLEFEDYHEDLICAKRNGFDYKALVIKAINKDGDALKEVAKLETFVDGAATEMFADRFWKIIHFWSDEELSSLLVVDNTEFKNTFSDFMKSEFYTGFAEKEIKEYLGLFYPKTLKLMDINKK